MAASYKSTAGVISAPHPTEKQLKQTLKNTKYSQPGSVARHILSTIETFCNLKPTIKEYIFSNGKRVDLMQLSGTIPVTIVDNLILQPLLPTFRLDVPAVLRVAYKSRIPSPTASSHPEDGWSIQPKRRQERLQYQVVYKRTFFTLMLFLDQEYNIPLRIWLQRGYPKEKPLVYINPTADMAIASVGYVERDGKVGVPYLSDWKEGRSDLTTLIQVVRFKFSQQCPVYTVRKTPLIPKSGSFTHPRIMSTGDIHAPQSLAYRLKKVDIEGKFSCEHDQEIEKMKKDIDESRVEINMLKSSLEAAKVELSQEKAHVEELKKSQVSDQRGSFTSSLIDAMQQEMQQQITTEKKMKEKYKQRLDTMVTEMTQAREEIGILRVDKEDYQQRLRAANIGLQHTKKKMQELRTELSTVQGKFEAAETNLAKEQAESESLRRNIKQMEEQLHEKLHRNADAVEPWQLQDKWEDHVPLQSVDKEEQVADQKEIEELRKQLKNVEEKLVLAANKAMEIEKEKDELFNSFMAQVSQASLMEQQLVEEKELLQLQLDKALQQLKDAITGQQMQDEHNLEVDKVKLSSPENLEGLVSSQQSLIMDEKLIHHSVGPDTDLKEQVMELKAEFNKLKEERDMLRQELEKALSKEKDDNAQQSRSEEEQKLREEVHNQTVKLRNKEAEQPSAEAYTEVIAERDNLKEKLLCKINTHEKSEKQMSEEIRTLQAKLSSTQEVADKLRSKLENELEKSKLTSQLEAELMEKTCVMSQLTAEKVNLKYKVLELQETVHGIQEKTRKESNKLEADLIKTSHTISQLTTEKEALLRKVQELQKQIQEIQHQTEPQISDKDVVSYEEIKLTQNILGTGAWGYVVMGMFRGKAVAIKCLHKDILSRFSKSQIQREISIMAELRHPNLVLFITAVLDAPTGPMIVTELLSYTLRRAYQEEIVTSCLEKLSVMQEVALALNYLHLHQKPIIHRDISSANVLLEELANNQWRAKLSDFGSANLVRLASTPGEGALVYSAPEMRTEAHKPQAPSADVYSYGVLLCEVLTSSFPDHSSLARMLEMARTKSQNVAKIIDSCLSEDPTNRPVMGVVILQLEELISTTFNN